VVSVGPVLRSRPAAVAAGLVIDRLAGEPPAALHPVAGFGRAMSVLEGCLWDDRRTAGVIFALTGAALGGAAAALVSRRSPLAGLAGVTWAVVAGRALADAARRVERDLDAGDLAAARADVPALVGRDPEHLDRDDIVRAVVESVAENTLDAVTAPAFWALLAGPTGAGAYRAVNTLDAMVGYRNSRYSRFGWASARLDDALNWAPARLTVLAVVAARPWRAAAVGRAVARQAPSHPSPNAGVVEAAFAAALGVSLGGVNHYGGRREERACLGAGPRPGPGDIGRALRLSRDVTVVAGLAPLVGRLAWVRRRGAGTGRGGRG
jgi:adenosylcobinamide-phosphate synthase